MFALHSKTRGGPITDDLASPAGCFATAHGTTQVQRLPCNDSGNGMTHMHAVGVHNPGHDPLVGVDIRRWNIPFRTQNVDERSGVAPSDLLQFGARELTGIANDSTLG